MLAFLLGFETGPFHMHRHSFEKAISVDLFRFLETMSSEIILRTRLGQVGAEVAW